jgi:hypothetical protein
MERELLELPRLRLLEVGQALLRNGWLKDVSLLDAIGWLKDGKLSDLLATYRNRFGVQEGQLLEHITAPRFCGRPDIELASGKANQPLIPSRQVRWFMRSGNLPGIANRRLLELIGDSWERLAALCGIEVSNVGSEQEANTLIDCGTIDGAMGTLAWSELANGSPTMVAHQMYDAGDTWQDAPGVIQASNKLDLNRVLDHENIHRLGLPHDTRNLGALMDPIYSLNVDRATRHDIDRLQAIYGPPLTTTKPTAGDTPAAPSVPTIPNEWVPIAAEMNQRNGVLVLRLPTLKVSAKVEG